MQVEKISYGGWPNCYRISNAQVELILTADVGPRVIRFGFVGGQNLFKEFSEQMGGTGETSWQIRGGHRLWIGPEDARYTYGLDNSPVTVEVMGDMVRATQATEPETGLQKVMDIYLAATGSEVKVASHHQPKSHGARIRALGTIGDGSGRRRHHGLSAARHTSRDA